MTIRFFGIGVKKWPRDINTEIVTKVVAVRAGNFSIGRFCTEFRCEQLCDDDIFWDGLKMEQVISQSQGYGSLQVEKVEANNRAGVPGQEG